MSEPLSDFQKKRLAKFAQRCRANAGLPNTQENEAKQLIRAVERGQCSPEAADQQIQLSAFVAYHDPHEPHVTPQGDCMAPMILGAK